MSKTVWAAHLHMHETPEAQPCMLHTVFLLTVANMRLFYSALGDFISVFLTQQTQENSQTDTKRSLTINVFSETP